MRKIFVFAAVVIASFPSVYGLDSVVINTDLMEIKAHMPEVKKIGVIFNPENVDLKGGAASVKAIALPVTNGPALLKQSRIMLRYVDAIYLMEGRYVTAEKLADMLVKAAGKTGVMIFSNDRALSRVPGVIIIGEDPEGSPVAVAETSVP